MARLPTVGGDTGNWGTVLNSFLGVSLVQSGTYAGSITLVSQQTTNYTIGSQSSLTTGGETVLANAAGGSITITLPNPSTTNAYTIHNIKKTDPSTTNTVTIATSSGYIDGGSTAVLNIQYTSITVVSDGTQWWII